MAGSDEADTSTPSGDTPMLARLTDGRNIAIFNSAKGRLPDAEWFEVSCDDEGHIALTPVQAVPDEAIDWAREQDAKSAAVKARPYQHLTVDELREVDLPERVEELRARGLISGGMKTPGKLSIKPVARVPGALERFLQERREQG